MKRLVDRLRLGGDLGPEDYAALLKGAAEGPLLAYAMQAAREVAVAPLLEKGFKGPGLGEALKRERLKALKIYKERHAL